MSVIVGCWSKGPDHRADENGRRMLAAQQDYGPHRSATWGDHEFALGSSLYQLLPEDVHDRQPLMGGGGRYVLVADVRLDNRKEVADRLGIGSGEALSDADLLLQALVALGETALDLILGDYAFGLWDAQERKLLLARDPLGQRPLYFHDGPRLFAFSTMARGLHALDGIERRADLVRLKQFAGILPLLGKHSFFEDVFRVEPGHLVVVTDSGVRSRRYWNPLPSELKLKRFDDYVDAFRAELDRAVESRLRGSGPVFATHLSSGWDSSAVTSTAARAAPQSSVLAFTSVPRPGSDSAAPFGRIGNEAAAASHTAARYSNVEHVLITGSQRSPVADLDLYVRLFDRPLYSLCNFVWLTGIREEAKARGSKVLLTGEMGNWSISAAPYSILADLVRQRRWGAWWREASYLARNRKARLRGIAANSFGPWVPSLLWRAVSGLSSRAEDAFYTPIHPALAGWVEAERSGTGAGLAWRPKDRFQASLAAFPQYDFGNIRKGTLAGWGIDERDPTADRRLIEFCLSLPLDMLLKNGERRPLARAALADRVPAEVLDQTRKGYQAADWHEGMTRDRRRIVALIEEIAANDAAASLLDVEGLRQWVRDWPEGGWDRPEVMARYRNAVLIAISAGHFILSTAKK